MRWLPVVAAAAALAANTNTAAAAQPNPCTLLTEPDVAGLLGANVASHTRWHAGVRATGCRWIARNRASLTLIVAQRTRAQYERSAHDTPRSIRVGGLGDPAFAVPPAEGAFLVVWRDGYALELSTAGVMSRLALEKRAARTALKRV